MGVLPKPRQVVIPSGASSSERSSAVQTDDESGHRQLWNCPSLYKLEFLTCSFLREYSTCIGMTHKNLNFWLNKKVTVLNPRVTHKGWDFETTCFLFVIPRNCKRVSFFAKSYNMLLKDYIPPRRLNFSLGLSYFISFRSPLRVTL